MWCPASTRLRTAVAVGDHHGDAGARGRGTCPGAGFTGRHAAHDRMPYPGLQTVVSNHALTLRNLIEGSIHGLVCNQSNQPVPNVTVVLAGPENAQTTTNAQGQFHFNDLTPGAYVVNVNGILRIVIVGSGEEEVAMAGLASPLDPGQFETLNPDLKIIIAGTTLDVVGPRVASVKVVSSQWTEPFLDEVDPAEGEGYPIPTGADQLKTLPWININEVLVKFSESMNIVASDISLHGVTVPNYGTAFNYDAASRTARIQLTGGNFIGADKLVLHINDTAKDVAGNALDGEWTNGVSTYAAHGQRHCRRRLQLPPQRPAGRLPPGWPEPRCI